MTTEAALEIRPSRGKHAGALALFVLLMLGFGIFGDQEAWPLHLGLISLMVLLTLPTWFDTTPRLVIAVDGLSWRKERKDPLSFLAWSEIAAADIKTGGEDEPNCLRLKLAGALILERIASGRRDDWAISIPVERLELSERALMGAIHRRAPHLFARKAA